MQVRLKEMLPYHSGEMRVNICTINVGAGIGNRNVAMDVYYFVDIFIFVDMPVTRSGDCVDAENSCFDLFSFVAGSGVEVYVRKSLVGWVKLVEHREAYVVLEMKKESGHSVMVGGVYIRPNRD